MNGPYIPPVSHRDLNPGEEMCGAEYVLDYGSVTVICEMAKDHAGAHCDDSMAGRLAWMTREEADEADAALEKVAQGGGR